MALRALHLDRFAGKYLYSRGARKAGAVVPLRETRGLFRSSFLHTARRWGWCSLRSRPFVGSPAGAYRRSQKVLLRIIVRPGGVKGERSGTSQLRDTGEQFSERSRAQQC